MQVVIQNSMMNSLGPSTGAEQRHGSNLLRRDMRAQRYNFYLHSFVEESCVLIGDS